MIICFVRKMKFVCSSDTHGFHDKLLVPEGDVFIFAGDFSDRFRDIDKFNQFLGTLSHKYKLIIFGNHELLYQNRSNSIADLLTNGILLNNSELTINGIKIWGMPWLGDIQSIPHGSDILITHIPPFGQGDLKYERHLGSKELLEKIQIVKPKYHVFGHIHESYGISKCVINDHEIICLNVAAITGFDDISNPPMIFEL